jgi:hypothetical protein
MTSTPSRSHYGPWLGVFALIAMLVALFALRQAHQPPSPDAFSEPVKDLKLEPVSPRFLEQSGPCVKGKALDFLSAASNQGSFVSLGQWERWTTECRREAEKRHTLDIIERQRLAAMQ